MDPILFLINVAKPVRKIYQCQLLKKQCLSENTLAFSASKTTFPFLICYFLLNMHEYVGQEFWSSSKRENFTCCLVFKVDEPYGLQP